MLMAIFGFCILVGMIAGLCAVSYGLMRTSWPAIVAGSTLFALATWLLAIH